MLLGLGSYLFVALVFIFIFAQCLFSACSFLQQDISSTHPVWFELIKGMPAAFVTLGIGLLATYVAWHQYKVARAKLKFDLFEKRLEIYKITEEFLLNILSPSLSMGDLNTFKTEIDRAGFLFGTDVRDYLDVVSKNASKLYLIHLGSKTNQNMIQPQDIQEHNRLSKWSIDQRTGGLREVFEKYLSFETWH